MRKYIVILLLSYCCYPLLLAQISHGGKPLPLLVQTKGMSSFSFEEMHSFDVEEELRIDSLNESDLRSGFRFAYKFITDFNRYNSGTSFYLEDGTLVWRLGIRSEGALSINVLFTEYNLPKGASLFLYNSDQSHILGSFNHLNNSELELLPVAPVYGDEIIIEYQEPANVAFQGRLTVGEVNHAYRSFRDREPGGTAATQYCMPAAICFEGHRAISEEQIRSVVLFIINGTTGCTGALINNTANNGKPYILTASHCLNENFKIENPDYVYMSSTIVSFFNYESPLCSSILRGTEEMSMASANIRYVNEDYDIAIVELIETPPAYYRPYYAGWNAEDAGSSPYFNVHHPGGSLKRVNLTENDLVLATFRLTNLSFAEDGHWYINRWAEGSTASGSSGSPLFDSNGYILGGLSGGSSTCTTPRSDYFFALSEVYKNDSELGNILNPNKKKSLICEPLNPYEGNSYYRLTHMNGSYVRESVQISKDNNDVPILGHNNNDIEYAEEYSNTGYAVLHGAYFVAEAYGEYEDLNVEVTVYSGTNKPEKLLHTETFRTVYKDYNKKEEVFEDKNKPLNRLQESYIHFNKPIEVEGDFFIGYRILTAPDETYFATVNTPKNKTKNNTAWIKENNQWAEASASQVLGYATSLFIDPIISYTTLNSNNFVHPNASDIIIIMGEDLQNLYVHLPEGKENALFSLYSAEGKLIKNASLNQNINTITLNGVAKGIYMIKVVYEKSVHSQMILF